MGCYNIYCSVSNISIGEDDEIVVLIPAEDYSCEEPMYSFLPFYGRYDHYGGLKDIVRDKHFNHLCNYYPELNSDPWGTIESLSQERGILFILKDVYVFLSKYNSVGDQSCHGEDWKEKNFESRRLDLKNDLENGELSEETYANLFMARNGLYPLFHKWDRGYRLNETSPYRIMLHSDIFDKEIVGLNYFNLHLYKCNIVLHPYTECYGTQSGDYEFHSSVMREFLRINDDKMKLS